MRTTKLAMGKGTRAHGEQTRKGQTAAEKAYQKVNSPKLVIAQLSWTERVSQVAKLRHGFKNQLGVM
jgi:hypothetical protein